MQLPLLDRELASRTDPTSSLLIEDGIARSRVYAAHALSGGHRAGPKLGAAHARSGTHPFRLPASWNHSHPFNMLPVQDWPYSFPRLGIEDTAVTLAGELCTPKDVLARKVPVKQLRVGDVIAFQLAGAYGWHISHHDFLNHPHTELVFLQGASHQ